MTEIIILCYGVLQDSDARKLKPKVVFVDEENRLKKKPAP